MPRIVVPLTEEEFDRLRDRALNELRHPRHTARLLLREALELPAPSQRARAEVTCSLDDRHHAEVERVPPDPLSPAAHITLSYDTDVEGAAEALLAILARPPTDGDPTTEPHGSGEESGQVD